MSLQQIEEFKVRPTRPFTDTDLEFIPLMDTGPGNGYSVVATDLTGFPLHEVWFRNPTSTEANVRIKAVGSLAIDLYYQDDNPLPDETFTVAPGGGIRWWVPDGIFVRTFEEGDADLPTPPDNPDGTPGDPLPIPPPSIVIEADQLIEISPVRLWTPNL